MTLKCPLCGEVCEIDVEVTEGQHVLCPFCERKFTYSSGNSATTTHKLRRIRHEDMLMIPEVRHKFDFRYLIERSFLLGRWSAAACDKCGRVDVFFQKKSKSGSLVLTCGCGNEFDMESARRVFKERFAAMLAEARRYREVHNLRERFCKQLKAFEDDWNFYFDPKTRVRIARLKEDTDRLYKKLEVANASRLIHAQHRTSNTILGYANTMHGFAGDVVSIIGVFGELESRAAENNALNSAEAIAQRIGECEKAIDYCNDLAEEFAGCSDKNVAKSQRLMKRVGYDDISKIPLGLPLDELQKLESKTWNVEENSARAIRSLRTGVEYVRSFAVALVVYVLGVWVFKEVTLVVAAILATIPSAIVFVMSRSAMRNKTNDLVSAFKAEIESR